MTLTRKEPKRILFATIPFDGHFNPLTSLAAHLKEQGHDVRWYTQDIYQHKLSGMGIRHYGFQRAPQYNQHNLDAIFPDRKIREKMLDKLIFDITHIFTLRGPEFYKDIRDIYADFPFEVLIADQTFTGIPFIREKMDLPVIAIGVMPLVETSRDLPPYGLGLTPSASFLGRRKQDFLRLTSDKVLFRKPAKIIEGLFNEYGIRKESGSLFDIMIKKSSLFLQSGVPGFEYRRSDLGSNIRFLGPLVPMSKKDGYKGIPADKREKYRKIILVTQGTVEKDAEKLLVPALEAFRNSPYLVVITTGGSGTHRLRAGFPDENFIIEDFIPFDEIMPQCDVYVSNGGFGGVMLGLKHGLPLVVAGVHEGKNEINARVGYFRLGVNMRTESPEASELRRAVEEVLNTPEYRENARQLSRELERYNPLEIIEQYVEEVTMDLL